MKAWGTVRRCPNKVSPIQINIMTPRHMGAVAEGVKPQSHRAYDQVTTLQSWSNRRKNVRLVAEVVCDRQGKISSCKFVVMFKTPKSPVTPGLRPGYDLPATEFFLESWAIRINNVWLIAEVVGDRQGKISRSKFDGHFQNV